MESGQGSVDARERAREVGRTAERNGLDPHRSFREVESRLLQEFGRKLSPLEREAAWEEHRKPRPWQ